ncbi:hypothetical protein [Cypionkella sp.]|uniref:hypothetical protein n=1 Tax=Cypionkella sp. TaxID=2811411 RepID=UPI00271B324D|nr:hypothetical protein [Cypionkella sp.]MDO8983785.1 hypothetical protein [Cypionkella sp.]MDP1575722.1 hypothetical protein [Cypionkella sp.]MDP2051657.1 hypothetical protein [Cypionkella sp.]
MIFLEAGATNTDKPFALYNNLLAGGTFSGTGSLAAGAAYANVIGPQTFDFWEPIGKTGIWQCTLPAPLFMDCVCIAAHNLDKVGTGLVLQTSADLLGVFTNIGPTLAPQLLANGAAPLGWIFLGRAVQVLRFYMGGAPVVAPQVGICYAGARVIFPGDVQPPYVPANEALDVEFNANITMGGHFAGGTITRQSIKQDVAFSPLARDFVQGDLVPFSKAYREGETFFFGGSPSYMPADLAYVWRTDGAGELRPAWLQGGRFADVKMTVSGYGA